MEKDIERRTTITKKMTLREYLTVCWMFENVEQYKNGLRVDLSDCDDIELSKEGKYSFRLTAEQKVMFDEFFNRFVTGKSFAAILGMVKKKGKMPISNIVSTPVDNSPISQVDNGEFLKRKPGTPNTESSPCVNAPVPTEEQRWEMLKQDRIPLKKAASYDEYPFIINPNEEFSVENTDIVILLKMFEQGKIDVHEMQEITGLKYNRFYSLPISVFPALPDEYRNEVDVGNCLIAAGEKYKKVKDIFEEPAPPENETLGRYRNYLSNYLSVVEAEQLKEASTFMDRIATVNGLEIIFETADDDEYETYTIKYNNAAQLKNDLICIHEKYKLDWEKPIDVGGKKTSVYKIVKEFYKKYPNGFNGEFFATRKEAYLAGKLEV